MSREVKQAKLCELVEAYGFPSPEELLRHHSSDAVVPGICTNPSCSFTADYEPDQRTGYCEECDSQTVASAFVLAELI